MSTLSLAFNIDFSIEYLAYNVALLEPLSKI